jgi:hypothetical protein
MKYGKTVETGHEYPIPSLLSEDNLAVINAYLEASGYMPYGRQQNTQVVVIRKEEKLSFWKKLMEGNRGLKVNDDL